MAATHYAFVCLHGSAKSVIASEYLNRTARERGIDARAAAFGQEPDAEIPAHVVEAMARKGFDLRGRIPQAVNAEVLAAADPGAGIE